MNQRLIAAKITGANKSVRILWIIVWITCFRFSPTVFHGWRRFLLRCFGASIGIGVHPYPSVKVWAPWNLEMGDYSCLSHGVICYNVAFIQLGKNVTVSQHSHLCTATHDYTKVEMPLMIAPIRICDYAWVTADVFVGPGVTIGEGAVVNARSSVFSDIPSWSVAKGYPAKAYKKRILKGINE